MHAASDLPFNDKDHYILHRKYDTAYQIFEAMKASKSIFLWIYKKLSRVSEKLNDYGNHGGVGGWQMITK